jgi:hypothetical protein
MPQNPETIVEDIRHLLSGWRQFFSAGAYLSGLYSLPAYPVELICQGKSTETQA